MRAHFRHWPDRLPHQIPAPATSLWMNLAISALRYPDKTALQYLGTAWSYRRLHDGAEALAAGLQVLGVRRGDRVMLDMQNCPQLVMAHYAILRLDAVVVPVNPMNRADELQHYIRDPQARVALITADLAPELARANAALPEAERLQNMVVTQFDDGFDPANLAADDLAPSWHDWLLPQRALPTDAGCQVHAWAAVLQGGVGEALAPVQAGPDDQAVLPYTSGTTGLPKGCIHTQRDMLYTAASNFGIALERADDTVFLSFFPQFWIAGENLGIIFPVFCGATLVLLTRWDPVAVMTAVQRYRVTCMAMPVDGAVELMDHPRFGDFDLSSLRQVRVVSFVKKLNLDYRRRWQQLTGGILAEAAWGMTETHTSDTFTTGFQGDDYDLHAQPVFVGLPVPGTEFKICDFETGALKPLGEDGEIRVRTPSLLKGYWRRPEATAEAIVDGWLRTGDIGLIDTDGFLHFLGRKKEMLKVKGMSVFPPEIEAVLGQHPSVLGSGVIGRTDAQRGEVPVAFVQLKPEADPATAVQSLTDWCASRMASYKLPEIRLVGSLPMTATGKVKKQDLALLL